MLFRYIFGSQRLGWLFGQILRLLIERYHKTSAKHLPGWSLFHLTSSILLRDAKLGFPRSLGRRTIRIPDHAWLHCRCMLTKQKASPAKQPIQYARMLRLETKKGTLRNLKRLLNVRDERACYLNFDWHHCFSSLLLHCFVSFWFQISIRQVNIPTGSHLINPGVDDFSSGIQKFQKVDRDTALAQLLNSCKTAARWEFPK